MVVILLVGGREGEGGREREGGRGSSTEYGPF